MIVVTLNDCPPKLRGDLSKWLFEINTGVYVGNVSARVREELWTRIAENISTGRATMIYSAPNEQKLEFRVHNTPWEPVDFDGLVLMRRPSMDRSVNVDDLPTSNLSKASKIEAVRSIERAKRKKEASDNYVVIDVETTGLSCTDNDIIEIAAIKFVFGKEIARYQTLVLTDRELTPTITELTGIDKDILMEFGIPVAEALREFAEFVGSDRIVSHNAAFDSSFIRESCKREGLQPFHNMCTDTLSLARKKLFRLNDFRLTALAEHFGFDANGAHRAMRDCELTSMLYAKLNEM